MMHYRSYRFWLSFFVLAVYLCVKPVAALSPNIAIYGDLYRKQLEEYRLQHVKTTIALQQLANLKTLAAQEEAVTTMRQYLLTRADVVKTHLLVLSETLNDRAEFEPLWQASASAGLVQAKADLTAHRERSDIAVDRIRADAEAAWFFQNQPVLLVSTDRALCLIALGKANESIQVLETAHEKIDTWIQTAPLSETAKVEKRRGSDELGRTIASARAQLETAKLKYGELTRGGSTAKIYPQIRPLVLNSYASVSRGVAYAKELTK